MRKLTVPPANVHDARGLASVLPHRPGAVYADAAYDGRAVHERIRTARGRPRIARRVPRGARPALRAAIAAWNAAIRPVRCRIEKIFGTCKRSYGLGRARYLGLAKMSLQAHLTALAFNLKRATALLRPQTA